MVEVILLTHADAACNALVARGYCIEALYSDKPDALRRAAAEVIRYADELSRDAERMERKYGSVFQDCRHDKHDCRSRRTVLPWILERANSGDEFAEFDVTSRSTFHTTLWDMVHDPAKLAEMLAHKGRRLGLQSIAACSHNDTTVNVGWWGHVVTCFRCHVLEQSSRNGSRFPMAQRIRPKGFAGLQWRIKCQA